MTITAENALFGNPRGHVAASVRAQRTECEHSVDGIGGSGAAERRRIHPDQQQFIESTAASDDLAGAIGHAETYFALPGTSPGVNGFNAGSPGVTRTSSSCGGMEARSLCPSTTAGNIATPQSPLRLVFNIERRAVVRAQPLQHSVIRQDNLQNFIWNPSRIIRPYRICCTCPSEFPIALFCEKIALPLSALKKSTCPVNTLRPARNVFLKFRSSWL